MLSWALNYAFSIIPSHSRPLRQALFTSAFEEIEIWRGYSNLLRVIQLMDNRAEIWTQICLTQCLATLPLCSKKKKKNPLACGSVVVNFQEHLGFRRVSAPCVDLISDWCINWLHTCGAPAMCPTHGMCKTNRVCLWGIHNSESGWGGEHLSGQRFEICWGQAWLGAMTAHGRNPWLRPGGQGRFPEGKETETDSQRMNQSC